MRRNKLFVIALLGYSVIALGGCAKREIKNIDSKGKNIICFGDSLTSGYAVSQSETYPAVLSRMIDIAVINAGIDGDTSIEALKRLKTDVLEREPLLVIIEFGGNDFLRKIPPETTFNNIRQIIDKVQREGSMVAIADISAGMFLSEYRKAFSGLAKQKGAIFIPQLLSGIIANPSLKSDFIHPNAEGYKLIAQKIHRAITPYLDRNISLKR